MCVSYHFFKELSGAELVDEFVRLFRGKERLRDESVEVLVVLRLVAVVHALDRAQAARNRHRVARRHLTGW